ncbi:phosphatidate cytidylyltransferase [Pseudogemmobacter sonorensis]|uniref:phosphatidate cytidylyltransferase n=1 Tax=Pseudogemmobacter sonorensis TaxID=2989681 RepID=UPI0036774690
MSPGQANGTDPGARVPGRWSDLAPRVLSALVMAVLGVGAVWAGGAVFAVLVLAVCAAMMWELARMTGAGGFQALLPALLALGVLALNLWSAHPWPLLLLLVPVLVGLMVASRDAFAFGLYAPVILMTGLALVLLRQSAVIDGRLAVVWLVGVVIASDVAGYFAGRILGGPKFWPRLSPKKTWSGTVAGWIAAALLGLGFVLAGQGGWAMVAISALVALAGQLGDIAESAIKRRAGVKDASALIPGHGGLMDRFDALAFAAIAAALIQILWPFLPLAGRVVAGAAAGIAAGAGG